jgi:hypothetical protein
MNACSSRGSSIASRSPRATSRLSAVDKAVSGSRVQFVRSPNGGAYPGRAVTISRIRAVVRLSAKRPRRSSVA